MKPDLTLQQFTESSKKQPVRVLIYDLETAPGKGYFWSATDDFMPSERVIEFPYILSFAAKWLGGSTVYFCRARGRGDKDLCRELHRLIDMADVTIAHNGRAFDDKFARARFVVHNMRPPAPSKNVDTYQIAKSRFRFVHNSLEGIATALGIGHKAEHEGFRLWPRCMAGDADAWARMERYNIRDVTLLEDVYLRLRPWDNRHPNIGLMHDDDADRCVCCGAAAIKTASKRAYTGVSGFDLCVCKACGKYQRRGRGTKRGADRLRNVA